MEDRQNYVSEEQDRYELNTEQGYFLMARSFIGSSTWHLGVIARDLAVYLIGKANHTRYKWPCPFQKKEIWIERGEYLRAQTEMFKEFSVGGGVTFKQFRGAFQKLASGGLFDIITPKCVKGAHSYTHIRLRKYDGYQNPQNYKGQLKGSLRAVEGQRCNTSNECNESNIIGTAPKKKAREAKPPPPAAIQTFREVAHRYPPKIVWPMVEKTIGEATVQEIEPYLQQWLVRGFNPTNLGWLFDWFAAGQIPSNGKADNPYRTGQAATWPEGDDAF
jgi:hypothetical protein